MEPVYNWGVHAAKFLPPSLIVLIACLALLISYALFNKKIMEKVFISNRSIAIVLCFIALSSSLWFLRVGNSFMGDGALFLTFIKNNECKYFSNYIDFLIHANLYQFFLKPHGILPSYSYAIIGCIAGLFFILVLYKFVTRHTNNITVSGPVFALLFFSGYTLQFYGYIESYTLLLLAISVYAYLSLLVFEENISLAWPLIALVCAILLHQVTVLLIPSFVLLLLVNRRKLNWIKRIHVLGILGILAVGLVVYLVNFEFKYYAIMLKKRGVFDFTVFVPLTGNYGLFSFNHLIDWLNVQLLSSPLSFALLPFAIRGMIVRKEAYARFLFSAFLPLLLFYFAMDPKIGMFRDWDLFSVPNLIYSLFVANFLLKADYQRVSAFIKVPLLAALIFQGYAWVFLNHDLELSMKRFLVMTESANRRDDVALISYQYEQLADIYSSQGNKEKDLFCRTMAAELSQNPRHYNNLGNIYAQDKDYRNAIDYYRKALLVKPDFKDPALNLAKAYYLQKDYRAAIRHCQDNIRNFPQAPLLQQVLVSSLFHVGQYDSAVVVGSQFLHANPCNLEILLTLATACMEKQAYQSAEQFFIKAQVCSPDNPRPYAGLAGLLIRNGNRVKAIANYRKARQLGWPVDPSLEKMSVN